MLFLGSEHVLAAGKKAIFKLILASSKKGCGDGGDVQVYNCQTNKYNIAIYIIEIY